MARRLLNTFKKLNMQVTVFTICYTAANGSNPAGRIATGFPPPSTAPQRREGLRVRGGHIQSRLPSGFFLYQPHPGSWLTLNTF